MTRNELIIELMRYKDDMPVIFTMEGHEGCEKCQGSRYGEINSTYEKDGKIYCRGYDVP